MKINVAGPEKPDWARAMSKRHIIPVSLLVALAVGVGLAHREGWPSGAGAEHGLTASTPLSATLGVSADERASEPNVLSVPTGSKRRGAEMARLSLQDETLLAEQVALQLLVQRADLELTADQWATFAAVTWHYQTVRQSFEATIATASPREMNRLEIPAYPVAGDALREKFFGELRERLGDDTAVVIFERAGSALEGYFGGFGVSVQTLEFAPIADVAGADHHVTRTASYWNRAEARETLTLRRETFFLEREDPHGERWGPFLALLAKRGAQKTGT